MTGLAGQNVMVAVMLRVLMMLKVRVVIASGWIEGRIRGRSADDWRVRHRGRPGSQRPVLAMILQVIVSAGRAVEAVHLRRADGRLRRRLAVNVFNSDFLGSAALLFGGSSVQAVDGAVGRRMEQAGSHHHLGRMALDRVGGGRLDHLTVLVCADLLGPSAFLLDDGHRLIGRV